jgi:hypothetical protein
MNLSYTQKSKEIVSQSSALCITLKKNLSTYFSNPVQRNTEQIKQSSFHTLSTRQFPIRPKVIHNKHHTTPNRTYRTFYDIPEVFSWASKHYKTWFKELTLQQRTAIMNYSWDQFKIVNNTLRTTDQNSQVNRIIKPLIQDLHSALKKSSLPEDIVVYRRADIRMLENYSNLSLNELVGKKILEKSFLSTSLLEKGTEAWKKKHNLLLKIHARKESNGAFIGFHSVFKDEYEMLFDKNHSFIIDEISYNRHEIFVKCTLAKDAN